MGHASGIAVPPSSEYTSGRLICQEHSVIGARLRWEGHGGATKGRMPFQNGNMEVLENRLQCSAQRGSEEGRKEQHTKGGSGGTGSLWRAWS